MTELEAYVRDSNLTPFERLLRLMEVLRSDQGCQWDRQQTHESLLPYLLEETYEVMETIEEGRYDELPEELGDLLIQVVFHAQLARERGDFEIHDSINAVVDKMIARHPHIFTDRKDLAPQQVRDQWERIKIRPSENKTVLGGVPKSLPALTMAFRIGEKAAGVGFDWNNPADVMEKIHEEFQEVSEELNTESPDQKERLTNEIGDLLFATASLARKLKIDPESALRKALFKFKSRFERLESTVQTETSRFEDFSLEQLEEIWQKVKSSSE